MVEKIIRVISSPNLKYYLFMLSERDCDCDSVEVNESAVTDQQKRFVANTWL